MGFNADFMLTDTQKQTIKQITKTSRPLFPNGYKKNYAEKHSDKIYLYNILIDCIRFFTNDIVEKGNYRDISFSYNEKKYAIVFSQPRK